MTERDYQHRIIDDELDLLMSALPAISLEGPKAVGKTATAINRAATIYRLDTAAGIQLAAADPERLATGPHPVVIDEWQRYPASWDVVKRAVDASFQAGRFLLTGSAVPRNVTTHSGAGRIVSLRMRPMSLHERHPDRATVRLRDLLAGGRAAIEGSSPARLDDYVDEILASGYPGIRSLPGRARWAALDGYVNRIAEVEIEELGQVVRRPQTLRRWIAAYAAATATTTSLNRIRQAAATRDDPPPSKSTATPYLDALQRLWIVDPVPAWAPTRNPFARVTESPKHHLADPAIAALLLGAHARALLSGEAPGPVLPRDGTLLGALFESLVTLSVRTYAQFAEARVMHFRSGNGDHEVDLIIEGHDRRVVALEVKLSATVGDDDVRHLRWLARHLGDELVDSAVITTGTYAYRRPDGIAVIPAMLLGP